MEMTDTNSIINSFPGYEFIQRGSDNKPHNVFRGTDIGFGGYIKSWPGIYGNVALLDVASLHPNSIRAMNCFGEYTKNFTDILDARIAIKHGDYETARQMLNGKLAPFLDDESTAKDLAQALKIAINSVYGLTAASFDNPFRDPRNLNNIVALRGALFMRTLQDEVEARGFKIVAIKTDSIKIADASKEIVDYCMGFAKKYGYTFEHEATYDKMCQINDADYIAKYKDPDWCSKTYGYVPGDNKKHPGSWTATGARFAVPYVFKTLFSHEQIEFEDMCETFAVSKGDLYLDMNEKLPDVSGLEKEREKLVKKNLYSGELDAEIDAGHNLQFVGRVGQFTPIKSGNSGGVLYRVDNGKCYAAPGSSGYRWLESEIVSKATGIKKGKDENGEDIDIITREAIDHSDNIIDRSFYKKLVDDAVEAISKYGDFEWFASDDPYIPKSSFVNFKDDAPKEVPFNDISKWEAPGMDPMLWAIANKKELA